MTKPTEITRAHLMNVAAYGAIRKDRRATMVAAKKNRRLSVGPHATFYFESFETMLYQVEEMLWIEKGGEAQIADELEAYNPLVPKGRDLSMTFMIEVEDEVQRGNVLARLGGIEETITLEFGDEKIKADWEMDADRTTPDGKTSAVHFLHFRFTDDQAALFRAGEGRVIVAINHENYGHMAVMPDTVRAELATDLSK